MPSGKPQAILLMGATATGKTDLAVKLVERFPVEIISVDSALIYQGMDIGTAKPDAQLLRKAPHFLIDIIDPAQSWSAWDFVQQALQFIHEINGRGHIPLLAGGTMMYFHALEQGMNDLPPTDEGVRQQINHMLQQQGLDALYQHLMDIDPQTASRLKATDRQRITRAIEVHRISGKPMSHLMDTGRNKPDIDFKRIILHVAERKVLHQRIEKRFKTMLEKGFELEVANLRERGDLSLDLPSMRCVGYRQMWEYLEGNLVYDEMVNKGIIATRQLAKRQLTWLRKYEQVTRVDFDDYSAESVYQLLEDT
jgi:tRNA dimethylallyltransferase